MPRAWKADWAALAAWLPYRRWAAATVASAAPRNEMSGVKANWASMIKVLALVSPRDWRMSHRARDQISPSAWTSPTMSSG